MYLSFHQSMRSRSHPTVLWLLLPAVTLLVTLVAGCAPAPSSGGASSSSQSSISHDRVRDPSGEGEICGGIAGFVCDEGLTCRYQGNYPDAAGVCVKL